MYEMYLAFLLAFASPAVNSNHGHWEQRGNQQVYVMDDEGLDDDGGGDRGHIPPPPPPPKP